MMQGRQISPAPFFAALRGDMDGVMMTNSDV
jgi:hypothetical protein